MAPVIEAGQPEDAFGSGEDRTGKAPLLKDFPDRRLAIVDLAIAEGIPMHDGLMCTTYVSPSEIFQGNDACRLRAVQ
jgi:hypothetical protein